MTRRKRQPRCVVIAGPNGSGKTTFQLKKPSRRRKPESFAAGVGRGLRMAVRSARKIARMYGTPIYVWENGRVVAKKP
ncbi:MAG TPA: hypothetical protein VHX52_13210 [Steroidobacteraceae bacterium]|jgi:ABC-type branched-subunit amino acid transport system ATPase component|nr:hypothetical protein [Steroidobacteraceae bacterium]